MEALPRVHASHRDARHDRSDGRNRATNPPPAKKPANCARIDSNRCDRLRERLGRPCWHAPPQALVPYGLRRASAKPCNEGRKCRGADSNRRPPGYESSALNQLSYLGDRRGVYARTHPKRQAWAPLKPLLRPPHTPPTPPTRTRPPPTQPPSNPRPIPTQAHHSPIPASPATPRPGDPSLTPPARSTVPAPRIHPARSAPPRSRRSRPPPA